MSWSVDPGSYERERESAYLAHDKVNFFGEEEKLVHTDGAGGRISTVRNMDFSLLVTTSGRAVVTFPCPLYFANSRFRHSTKTHRELK